MKTLWLLSAIILMGCLSQKKVVHEDTMMVTRKYIGVFDTLIVSKRTTQILTDKARLSILGKPEINIPKKVRCYVKYVPERMPGSNTQLWVLYFTWDGTNDLYRVYQNPITGEIF